MTTKNDGGPAFPNPNTYHLNGQVEYGASGMSLRDYFAVHASEKDVLEQAEVIRASLSIPVLPEGWRTKARYMHADAMLKAREAK